MYTEVRGWWNEHYSPPAPFARIEIASMDKKAQSKGEALLDTGSDGSALPKQICEDLDLYEFPIGIAEVSGVGVKPEERVLYAALIRFEGMKRFIEVEIDCREDIKEIILGRNFLNNFKLILNPIKGEVSIQQQ